MPILTPPCRWSLAINFCSPSDSPVAVSRGACEVVLFWGEPQAVVLEGAGEKKTLLMTPGHLFLMFSKLNSQLYLTKEAFLARLILTPDEENLFPDGQVSLRWGLPLTDELVRVLFESILETHDQTGGSARGWVQVALGALVFRLQQKESESQPRARVNLSLLTLRQLVEILRNRRVTSHELSGLIGFSPGYLSRAVRALTGQTLLSYGRYLRTSAMNNHCALSSGKLQ